MEPAIDAIGTAYAVVDVVRLLPSHGDGSLRGRDDRRAVVRMDLVARSPAFQLFERCAQVFEDMPVRVLDLAGRRQESDHGGYDVGHRPMAVLAVRLTHCGLP